MLIVLTETLILGKLPKLAIVAVGLLLDWVKDKAVLPYGEVVIVDLELDGFLKFLYFLLLEFEVEVGDAHGE